VRKQEILGISSKSWNKMDLAARIIQFYWRQYLEYCQDYEDIEPQELLQKPHSPIQNDFDKIEKRKEKLGLVDYDYIPKISDKSRKLANKRRKNQGLSKMSVEDVLLQENRRKKSTIEKNKLLKHMKEGKRD